MELLKGVIGQDGGASAFSDAKDECIPTTDGPGRGGHDLPMKLRLLELGSFRWVDAMTERSVDDDDDFRLRVLFGV